MNIFFLSIPPLSGLPAPVSSTWPTQSLRRATAERAASSPSAKVSFNRVFKF